MECSSHGKPLEVYCDTCDKLICQLCTTAKAHRNHEYEPLTDAFPRHQQQIVNSLEQVKKKLAAITTAVQAVETQEGGFLEQVGAVRREIEATVQQLMQFLQELHQLLDCGLNLSPHSSYLLQETSFLGFHGLYSSGNGS